MSKQRRGLIATLLLPVMLGGYAPTLQAAPLYQPIVSTNQAIAAAFAQGNYVKGELIVQYKSEQKAYLSKRMASAVRVARTTGKTSLLQVPADKMVTMAQEMMSDPNVSFVEPNYLFHAHEMGEPNDDSYPEQYGLPMVEAPAAWEQLSKWPSAKKETVIVAVADTGVDHTHPDLASRTLLSGYNTVDNNDETMDRFGHGTHVAGIIAAHTNNSEGVAGIVGTENIKILPIKVINDKGQGDSLSVANGINKAVERGADVINMSLGGKGNSRLVHEAVQHAIAKGVTVIVSSGNAGAHTEGQFPALYPETITVASVGVAEKSSIFSNYGSAVDIAAPGEYVLSTVPDGGYMQKTGTSMATPFVAGAAALVKLAHPDWTPQEIRNALEKTAKDIDKPGFDASTGSGLLQVDDAISYDQAAPVNILMPRQGDYVWDNVQFQVQVNDKQAVYLQLLAENGDKVGEKAVISNGQATFTWDSKQAANGTQRFQLQALNAANQPLGTAEPLQLKVTNSADAGIQVSVLDHHQKPAYGSLIHILQKQANEFQTVFSTFVNDQGLVYIPRAILLPNESYTMKITTLNPDGDHDFTHYRDISADTSEVTINMSESYPLNVSLTGTTELKDAAVGVVPLLNGVEASNLAQEFTLGEAGTAQLDLPAGKYVAYAKRFKEYGTSFYLRKIIEVKERETSLSFNLAEAKPVSFKLPKWASNATWYPAGSGFPETGISVTHNTKLLMTPFVLDNYKLEVGHPIEDREWKYTLMATSPTDLGKYNRIVVSHPTVRPSEASTKPTRSGEEYPLAYGFNFGEKLQLTGIDWNYSPFEDEDEDQLYADPMITLTNQQGEAVWSGKAFQKVVTIPTNYNITSGLYSITADFSKTPYPLKQKQVKIGTVMIENDNSSVIELELTTPGDEGFRSMTINVLDKETKEVLATTDRPEMLGNYALRAAKLTVGKHYLFQFSGMTEENVPLYAERLVQLQSNKMIVDMSQKSTRPTKFFFDMEAGAYLEITRKGSSQDPLLLTAYDNAAWLDAGAYDVTALKLGSTTNYVYRTTIEVDKASKTIEIVPDQSQLVPVSVHSEATDTTWSLGISTSSQEDWENGDNSWKKSLMMVPMGKEATLHVTPGEYHYALLKSVTTDDVTTAYLYDAQPETTKQGYVFETDEKLAVSLKTEESARAGESLGVEVDVTDSHGNKVTEVMLIAEDPVKQLDVPLRLVFTEQGIQLAAYYEATREYKPLATQRIQPVITINQNEKMLISEKIDTWDFFTISLPNQLKTGIYTLTWDVYSPVSLNKETTFSIK